MGVDIRAVSYVDGQSGRMPMEVADKPGQGVCINGSSCTSVVHSGKPKLLHLCGSLCY